MWEAVMRVRAALAAERFPCVCTPTDFRAKFRAVRLDGAGLF
jgi:hypothetical protein